MPPKKTSNPIQVFTPSGEQQAVIDALKFGQNVIVNAVAGSGKTTTILGLAKQMPDTNILQVTYNKALKLEVKEKIAKNGLTNITTHTYHGLGCCYYDYKCWSDEKIEHIVNKDTPLVPQGKYGKHPDFSIVVIDEAQDMTELYFRLIYKFIKDLKSQVKLLILGDTLQGIYEFKGADVRYLTLANEIFITHQPFTQLSLNTSYRITHQISQFVNTTLMNGGLSIHASKEGVAIDYYKISGFAEEHILEIAKYINELITEKKATADDFFILAYSINNNRLVKRLENILVDTGISCFVPISEDTELKDKVIKNKVVFTTFHQSKGRERPYVILFGFDSSYFKYYGKTLDTAKCPNIVYVAATRASKHLLVIEDTYHGPLPFIKDTNIQLSKNDDLPDTTDEHTEHIQQLDNLKYISITQLSTNYNALPDIVSNQVKLSSALNEHKTSVTEFIKFIKEKYLADIDFKVSQLFTTYATIEATNIVEFPKDVQTSDKTYEEVADINGVVIPAMLDTSEPNCLYKFLIDDIASIKYGGIKVLKTAVENLVYPCNTPADWLSLGNIFLSHKKGYYYKLAQITKYDWLTQEQIDKCHSNIKRYITNFDEVEFERGLYVDAKYNELKDKFNFDFGKIAFTSIIDAIDDNCIWEFKCTERLTLEHKLQLIVYYFIWDLYSSVWIKDKQNRSKRFMLMNIRTGEVLELNIGDTKLIYELIELLMRNKYEECKVLSDDEFIHKNMESVQGWIADVFAKSTGGLDCVGNERAEFDYGDVQVSSDDNYEDEDFTVSDDNEEYDCIEIDEDVEYDMDTTTADTSTTEIVTDYTKMKLPELRIAYQQKFGNCNGLYKMKKREILAQLNVDS